jgi:hypothetical protein
MPFWSDFQVGLGLEGPRLISPWHSDLFALCDRLTTGGLCLSVSCFVFSPSVPRFKSGLADFAGSFLVPRRLIQTVLTEAKKRRL